MQDITKRKRALEEIAYLASHDSLTGLYNQLVFLSELAEAIVHRQPLELVAVLYLDLDDFMEINDRLGHAAGDAILVEVCRRLRSCGAMDDIVARFGGDACAMLRTAAATVEKIQARVNDALEIESQPIVDLQPARRRASKLCFAGGARERAGVRHPISFLWRK